MRIYRFYTHIYLILICINKHHLPYCFFLSFKMAYRLKKSHHKIIYFRLLELRTEMPLNGEQLLNLHQDDPLFRDIFNFVANFTHRFGSHPSFDVRDYDRYKADLLDFLHEKAMGKFA